jgi:hypothetical protein
MAISGSAAIGAEVLAWSCGKDRSWLVVALALFAIATDGRDTVNQGWIALRHFSLNMIDIPVRPRRRGQNNRYGRLAAIRRVSSATSTWNRRCTCVSKRLSQRRK